LSFNNKSNLVDHKRTKHIGLDCPRCGAIFHHRSMLIAHKKRCYKK
jgi:uncharacterized C2H2 Zn-finger protein